MSIKPLIYLICYLLFGAFWEHKIYTGYAETPDLTIIGGVSMADGLGRQSIELMEALNNSLKIEFIPTYVDSLQDLPQSILPFLHKKKKQLGSILFCQEPIKGSERKIRSSKRSNHIKIAYSMIESTAIPPDWVKRLNTHFDLVAVPDKFLIKVYEECGVKIPIFELPLGRNFHPFLTAPLKSTKNSPFVFGSFGAGIDRKNQITLIRAFRKAFGNRSDVLLKIHCRMCNPDQREKILTEIEGSSIQFTETPLDQLTYFNFLKSIDGYVSPSKGEGFSIQPREAMALGIPAIVTDNTAQHTICESGYVRIVASNLEEPARYEWRAKHPCGSFFPCDLDDLTNALIDMEQNYSDYLSKAPLARAWASQYDYPEIKPYYLTLLKPNKVILGRENKITPDALITTSKELYQKYQRICRLP